MKLKLKFQEEVLGQTLEIIAENDFFLMKSKKRERRKYSQLTILSFG